ncbi:MAG TPA: glycosyltransferase [Niabella sp.]|nr:glycosyltransferase [Niabella sp.]HOZ97365.1 glycosyltransferase [Niabella sp.]HQW15364.1 glycosyltransferase [Niabella sp.]HQX20590.1 glycosyltransferase [Niabella sp.]HQX40975.1 glycosyltransferase [Niabella sp.]
MRVLQIINALGTGGAEKLLLDTLPLYRKQGIEMDILLFWNHQLPFTKALMALNICKVYILHETDVPKDIYKLSNIPKLAAILKNYDIAHVHLFPAQYYTVLANWLNGKKTKLVFTEHNTSNSRTRRPMVKPIERLVYRGFRHLICISEDIETIYRSYLKFPDGYYKRILNGVDLDNISNAISYPRSNLWENLSETDRLMIQVSSFRAQKDQPTLIRVMQLLPEKFKLILVGDGPLRADCEQLVRELNLNERVFFMGQRMDVPQLLKTADFVVLSSHYEGLSLSSVEGLASGRPFIASDVVGLREVVQGAGCLFPAGDASQLAREILNLEHHPEDYQRVAAAGLVRARQFDISTMVQKHIDLYKSLM